VGVGDLDITPISARTAGTCPFCGDGTKVTKSVLLIRSTSSDWTVKTKNGTYSPSKTETVAGVNSKAIRTATCDNVIKIPEFVLSTDETDFELTLPDTASAYVSNGNSVVRIVTTGKKKRQPITFTENSVSVNDGSTAMQVAVDNVIAQIDTNSSEVTINNDQLSISVSGSESPIVVNESNPQVVVTDNGGSAPIVEVSKDLIVVTAPVIQELEPEAVKPGLSPAEARSLANSAYVEAVATVPTTPVTAPPITTTTSTTTTIKSVATTLVGTAAGSTESSSTTVATPGSTSSSTPPSTSGSTSSSTSTSTSTTTSVALNCVFVINGYGVQGFNCNNGTQRGWRGYLTRFPGDTYYFNFGPDTGYQYGDYTVDYDVESVPAGFTASGRYTGGGGCHPYGCP